MLFFLQITVKAVLNLRKEEAEFYNSIVTLTDVILRRGDGVDVMEVDNDILGEAAATASFAEQTGVFDKAPDAESPPPADRTIPQKPNPSIPNATLDKLVSEVAQLKANQVEMMASHVYIKANHVEIKANQVEIKAKLDLVLQLEKNLLDLFKFLAKRKTSQPCQLLLLMKQTEHPPPFQLII